jgi:hypothetical protein
LHTQRVGDGIVAADGLAARTNLVHVSISRKTLRMIFRFRDVIA